MRIEYENYLKSNRWKCDKAPIDPNIPLQVENNTGAHHWVCIETGAERKAMFLCIHCFDVRKFVVVYEPNYNLSL